MTTNYINLLPHESAAAAVKRLGCIIRPIDKAEAHRGYSILKSPFGSPGTVLACREEWIYSGSCASYSYNSKSFVEYVTYASCGTRVTIPVTEETARAATDGAIEYQDANCPKITVDEDHDDYWVQYEAYDKWLNDQFKRVRPSSEMPDWAIRRRPTVSAVRCVRAQDVTEEEWKAWGVIFTPLSVTVGGMTGHGPYLTEGARLFDVLHGPGSWDANQWLWLCTLGAGGGK